jgi:hypothetical protein
VTALDDSRPYWRGLRYPGQTPPEPEPKPDLPGWRIVFDQGTAFISGPTKAAVRRRIAVAGDRGPAWVERRAAWATSPHAASAVLDQLERQRIPAAVEDVVQAALDLTDTQPANSSDRQGELF